MELDLLPLLQQLQLFLLALLLLPLPLPSSFQHLMQLIFELQRD